MVTFESVLSNDIQSSYELCTALVSVKEDALDNRQQHFDVMCSPVLFPTGEFASFILVS